MKLILHCALVIILYGCYKTKETTGKIPHQYQLKLISDGFRFPTALAAPADSSHRIFICEQEGLIRIIRNDTLLPEVFFDLRKLIKERSEKVDIFRKTYRKIRNFILSANRFEERGLLGMAFHPDFKHNRKFYVCYSAPASNPKYDHEQVVEEFEVAASDPNKADGNTGRKLFGKHFLEKVHNGGDIKFGNDRCLYIAIGDGGYDDNRDNQHNFPQSLSSELGKILRIDVNTSKAPTDNPFVNVPSALPQIYAYGFRNPWRISFDRLTGRLFVADVGQHEAEEINLVQKGGNYGWRLFEGTKRFDNSNTMPNDLEYAIATYPHGEDGISVTGGFVYRGKAVPQLYGKYIFGDLSGNTFTLTEQNKNTWLREKLLFSNKPENIHLYSFGEDQAGELYILAVLHDLNKAAVYRITQ